MTEPHVYLSTGCHHGDEPFAHGLTEHEYCQGKNGILGSKKPAQCKGETCGARCICPCHPGQPTPAAVEVRDPCPHCEGSPTRIPRHAMADHMRTHHPEEQQMPDTPTTPCTATIDGPHVLGGGPVQCTREAGHPENHVGPKRGTYGRALWTDHNAGATPHGASSEEQPHA